MNDLRASEIALIPDKPPADKQSIMAIKYLKWLEHSEGVHIQHAGNAREQRFGQYKVDGYIPAVNGGCPKVIEFNGYVSFLFFIEL